MELFSKAGFYAARLLWTATRPKMKMQILNRCSDIELVDLLYFSSGAVCNKPLGRKAAPGGTLNTAFKIDLTRMFFEGALICRLMKKRANFDQQFDTDTTSIDKESSTRTQFLVGWKLERFRDPLVYMMLLEHGEELVWNEDMLIKQYNEFLGRLNVHNGSVTSTWLLEDGSVLRLTLDGVGNKEYGIRIVITDAQQNEHTSILVWIEQKV
jgi:hypothetical protein